jgi:hypothetical protein
MMGEKLGDRGIYECRAYGAGAAFVVAETTLEDRTWKTRRAFVPLLSKPD